MKVLTLELTKEIIVFAISPEVPISKISVDFIYTNKKTPTKPIGQDLLEKNKNRK